MLWLAFARDHNIYSVPMFGLSNSLTTDFYRTKLKGPDRPKRYLWVESVPRPSMGQREPAAEPGGHSMSDLIVPWSRGLSVNVDEFA
jgi:hypothetical protein